METGSLESRYLQSFAPSETSKRRIFPYPIQLLVVYWHFLLFIVLSMHHSNPPSSGWHFLSVCACLLGANFPLFIRTSVTLDYIPPYWPDFTLITSVITVFPDKVTCGIIRDEDFKKSFWGSGLWADTIQPGMKVRENKRHIIQIKGPMPFPSASLSHFQRF